jgi:hypothetical protein
MAHIGHGVVNSGGGRLEGIWIWGSILYGPVISMMPTDDPMLYDPRIREE